MCDFLLLHSECVIFDMLNPDLSVHIEFNFSVYSNMFHFSSNWAWSEQHWFWSVSSNFWHSEKGIVAVALELGGCLEAGHWGEGQQGLGKVRGQVQRLGSVLGWGERKRGTVGKSTRQSMGRQWGSGVRTHLIQSQSALVTVERVRGRWSTQT